MPGRRKKQQLVLVSILVLVLISYPFISIANRAELIGGIPILYAYLFLVWLLTIILLYSMMHHTENGRDE